MAQLDDDLFQALAQPRGDQWPANNLCDFCKSILSTNTSGTIAHRKTAAEIKESAYQGCHMCALLHGSFPLVPQEDCQPSTIVRHDGPWYSEVTFGPSATPRDMTIECCVAEHRNDGFILTLRGSSMQLPEANIPSTALNGYVNFADNTGSSKTLRTAKAWIQECLGGHHDACRPDQYEQSRTVPTRLIEIHDNPTSLSLVQNCDSDVRYLILSYCWGVDRADELKLQRTNEEDLRHSIPFGDLPRTVSDAIVATRKLGYHLLWVDRLCILQDDDDDWKGEAARMGSYYANSERCIAAEWSDDARKGLFAYRNPLCLQPLQVEDTNSNTMKVISAERIGYWIGHYPKMYRGPGYPLSKRAWVLQERLLSPRTVYFGSMMVYWECRKMRRAENHPYDDIELAFSSSLRKLGPTIARSPTSAQNEVISQNVATKDDLRLPISRTQQEMNPAQEHWADIVEHYTRCGMTYPNRDRLVAISGIMSSISAKAQEKFVYGLLASRLATELLWWQWVDADGDDEKVPVRTGAGVNAPTWSWGSVAGRTQPLCCRRYLNVERGEGWEIEIKASIEQEPDRAVPENGISAEQSQICRIEYEALIVEAVVETRIDRRHYCWHVRAVGQSGLESFFTFQAKIWPDEPVQEGMAVWLLRCALGKADEARYGIIYAGLVIAPLGPGWDSSSLVPYWRRIGYWETSASVVSMPATSVSTEQKQSDWRTAINAKHKVAYLK